MSGGAGCPKKRRTGGKRKALPAGISFFTFQIVAYAIDRFRGEIPDPPTLRRLALYIGFFPQLVAGPILRFHDVADSLRNLRRFNATADDIARAVGYVTVGLAVKVLIADTLSAYVATVTDSIDSINLVGGTFTILAYSFQIYFDFYGYSMVAIGLGALFGFHFPANFLRPYDSVNIRDFWRRWHVTLSFWIRDYLYLPLGGNRAYVRNILIVFAACGLWHGAGWNFVVWGAAHGVLVVAYHGLRGAWDRMPVALQRGATFVLVSVLWLLFLFDFDHLARFLAAMGTQPFGFGGVPVDGWIVVAIAAAVCFGLRLEDLAENRDTGKARSFVRNAIFGLLMVAVLVFLDRSQTFIYFRF